MIIQISGCCDFHNVREVEQLDVDTVGFDFRNDSPRYVRMIMSRAGIIPDYSQEQIDKLKNSVAETTQKTKRICKRVGLYQDDMLQRIVMGVYSYALDIIELSGNELPLFFDNLRKTLLPDIHPSIELRKVCVVNSVADVEAMAAYGDVADSFRLTLTRKAIEDKVVDCYNLDNPFLISLTSPADWHGIKPLLHNPHCVGISLDNMFETAVGVKNVEEISEFLNRIKSEKAL